MKKLNALGKKFPLVLKWKTSIIRHLYYVAQEGGGDPDKNEVIWRALSRHICNVHGHATLTKFPKCQHVELSNRLWFNAG